MRVKAVVLCMLVILCCLSTVKAVTILQYHHVRDTTPSATSISVAQFTRHMDYLKQHNYTVLPLDEIIDALKQGKELDRKTVAITFDDGYRNILTNADPILKEMQYPYSIFIAPEEISQNRPSMLNWQTLRQLLAKRDDVLILNHSLAHKHLNRLEHDESNAQWRTRIINDITQAQIMLEEKLGRSLPKYLAYPYGEYNNQLLTIIDDLGFVGFGQHSGPISAKSNFLALPRFPASGRYADLKTLSVKLQTLVMPVTKLVNHNPQLDQHTQGNPKRPELTMSLDVSDIYKPTLACYILGKKTDITWINNKTFSIAATVNLPAGRSRYNCTAQSRTKSGYYWFSQPWINRKDDGSWSKG